jgi:hypothetical protein
VPDHLWQGRFNIVAGQPREDGPYATLFADRQAAGVTVSLCVVIQPTRPDTDNLCVEVQRAIDEAFGHPEYSITGNLLLACGAAHQRLRQWNRASLPQHQMGVGLTLLAIAGNEAYLAQVGPSIAFYRHTGRLDRLEPLEQEARRPLGLDDTLAPWFHRLQLGPTDMLLLVTSNVGERVDPRAIDHLLALDPDTALPEIYRYVRAEPNVGVVLIGMLGEPQTLPEGGNAPEAAPAPVTAAKPVQRAPERVAEPAPEPPRRRPPSPLGSTRFGLELPPEILEEPPLEPSGSRNAFQQLLASLDSFRRVRAEHPDSGGGVLHVLGSERPRQPVAPPFALPSPEAVLAGADEVVRPRINVRATAPGFRAPFPVVAAASRINRRLLFGGLAAAIVLLMLVAGIPALANSGRTQRFNALLSATQSKLASAQNEPDLGKRRELLNQAMSDIDEARHLKPKDPRAQAAASSVADAVTTLDAVYQLPSVPALADLSGAGLSPSSDVEVATGDRFYVLDVASGRVIGVPRDNGSQPEVIYEAGSSVDGVQGAKAAHIAWQPGDPGTLLILDAQRHLFGYSRLQLRTIPLRGVEQWKSATAMAFANSALYILDAQAGIVWRYAPSSDGGFSTDPAPAAARADLKDGQAISVVGGIFVVGQEGRIRRYLDNQESVFTMPGIDKLPTAPQPPLYDAGSGALFVADRGNGRIIQLQGDGRFQRQLVNAQLTGLRALAVDPGQNRLIGVIGQTLVAIPLPK